MSLRILRVGRHDEVKIVPLSNCDQHIHALANAKIKLFGG